jgi:hypothetical protein
MKLHSFFRSSAAYRVRIALEIKASRMNGRSPSAEGGAQTRVPGAQSRRW